MQKATGKSSRRAFEYKGRSRTAEDVTRASKTSGGSFDSYLTQGTNTYKPREGENNIRVLPLTWDDTKKWGKDWAILIYVHHSIGADNSAYLCINKMNEEECPICEARNESDDEDEKKGLRTTKRALCWLIDRDNEKAGPQAWSMPLQLYRDIQTRSIDKETKEVIYIDDPDEGFDISFVKEGTGLHTKYLTVEIARKPSAISDGGNGKRQARWLDLITNQPLPDVLNFYDAEYLSKILEGKSAKSSDDEDEDEDEKPTRKRGKVERKRSRTRDEDEDEDSEEDEEEAEEKDERATRSNKRRVSRDEEDEEDEETDDDDVEEEEKKPSKRKSKDDDDEDEDSEEDDEEEEEKPRRKSKVSGKRRADDGEDEESDDDGEETEEDSEDDDERPSSKRKARSSKEDDADDEEEESDDDEDDEKPKGKSASARAKAKLAALKKKRSGK